MTWARWPRWRRQPAPEREPEAVPAATLDDADIRRLAVGVLLAALDDDDAGIRNALAGLTVSDLIELAGELGGLGAAVWRTRGASRDALRDSLQMYAWQLATELPGSPQRARPAATRSSPALSRLAPSTYIPETSPAILARSGGGMDEPPAARRGLVMAGRLATSRHIPQPL